MVHCFLPFANAAVSIAKGAAIMTLTLPTALFLIAGILFAIDFLLGFAPDAYGRWRINALAWALVAFGLMFWKAGK
jgi:hypothetical protein